MKTINKIKHSILFVLLIAIFGLLSFSLKNSNLNSINKIEIEGANYLSSKDYMEIANLSDFEKDPNINITVIQDRIEKHPYVNNADVWLAERGTIRIKIIEKTFEALILTDKKQFLITGSGEIIPFYSSTKNIDLPVIVNVKNADEINVFSFAGKYQNLKNALKIISTSEIYDENLSKRISEINLNNGKDITVTISDQEFPIYMGSDSEVEKTIYLSKILKHIKNNGLSNYVNYLDLRFTDLVYLGFKDKLVSLEEKI